MPKISSEGQSKGPTHGPHGRRFIVIDMYTDGAGWSGCHTALALASEFDPYFIIGVLDPTYELAPRTLADILAYEV